MCVCVCEIPVPHPVSSHHEVGEANIVIQTDLAGWHSGGGQHLTREGGRGGKGGREGGKEGGRGMKALS